MSSLKAFEDATHWRPASLRPVRTSEADVTAGLPAASEALPVSPQPTSTTTPASINSPQYRTANFMMYGFKVALCSRSGRHKWDEVRCVPLLHRMGVHASSSRSCAHCTGHAADAWRLYYLQCPFAHPTENARRRDPRIFSYSCQECPSYRCAPQPATTAATLQAQHLPSPRAPMHLVSPQRACM